jgi:hypothetical protein
MLPPKARGSFDDNRPQLAGGATHRRTDRAGSPAPRQLASVCGGIERDVKEPRLLKILRQRSHARELEVPAPVLAKLDIENAHFKDVAGLGAFDLDRTSEVMRSGSPAARLEHGAMIGKNREAGFGFEQMWEIARKRLDCYAIA